MNRTKPVLVFVKRGLARHNNTQQDAIATKHLPWILALLLIAITSYVQIAQVQFKLNLQVASAEDNPPVEGSPNPRDSAGTYQKPPVEGRPDPREPAGTRGGCEVTDTPFTPLLPISSPGTRFSGYTLTGHPTFWFYVPYKTSSIRSGKFSLEDEQEQKPIYQTDFKLPETPGFVSIRIPIQEKALEKNKLYKWTFTLFCASPDSTPDEEDSFVFHQGLVQRVEKPSLETQLKTATLSRRINLYVENNIWYDASIDLVETHALPEAWLNLLRAIGLEQLVQTPITGAVVLTKKEN
jgi:hypothetical protein